MTEGTTVTQIEAHEPGETPRDPNSKARRQVAKSPVDDRLLSPSSQIGRAAQTGGTPESGRPPDESSREGWSMPDQSDTPDQWPEPTTDS